MLAITNKNELYTWGMGEYGALGFGTREDILQPRHLNIQRNEVRMIIIEVSAGKYHSMVLI